MPTFRGGGMEKFREWFMDELEYPVGAYHRNLTGRSSVQFVVGKDDSLGGITLLEASDEMFDETVIHLLEKCPAWEPASMDGEPVSVRFTLLVEFRMPKERPNRSRSSEWQSGWGRPNSGERRR